MNEQDKETRLKQIFESYGKLDCINNVVEQSLTSVVYERKNGELVRTMEEYEDCTIFDSLLGLPERVEYTISKNSHDMQLLQLVELLGIGKEYDDSTHDECLSCHLKPDIVIKIGDERVTITDSRLIDELLSPIVHYTREKHLTYQDCCRMLNQLRLLKADNYAQPLGRIAQDIKDDLLKADVFTEADKITELYAFIFDVMYIHNILSQPGSWNECCETSNSDKYKDVLGWLRASGKRDSEQKRLLREP